MARKWHGFSKCRALKYFPVNLSLGLRLTCLNIKLAYQYRCLAHVTGPSFILDLLLICIYKSIAFDDVLQHVASTELVSKHWAFPH